MTRRFHAMTMAAILTVGGGLPLATHPAMAQGPYGRNSYEDFPFNQGSLFYRPLKPKPKPRVRATPRPFVRTYPSAPPAGYPSAPRPYTYGPQPRYYYYPANPGAIRPQYRH